MRILGFGSPLLDLLLTVEEEFLATIPGGKGGMVMVEPEFITQVCESYSGEIVRVPGGSAGNTVFALARLKVACGMFGKLGSDDNGNFYRTELCSLGGDDSSFALSKELPTGCCLCLVTPDGERTMRPYLGAAVTLQVEDVDALVLEPYDLVHIEGYMLCSNHVLLRLLELANKAGKLVSLDLASYEVVRDYGAGLIELLKSSVDIVFANEDEAKELFKGETLSEEEMVQKMASWCGIAALKLGGRGALIAERSSGRVWNIAPTSVSKVVDTTGAGDYWQAGFLYGLAHGCQLDKCGEFGAVLGAEVVQIMGADLPETSWERVIQRFAEIGE